MKLMNANKQPASAASQPAGLSQAAANGQSNSRLHYLQLVTQFATWRLQARPGLTVNVIDWQPIRSVRVSRQARLAVCLFLLYWLGSHGNKQGPRFGTPKRKPQL